MPNKLKSFLETLSPEDSQAIWDYLDEVPDAIHEMIALVAPNAPATQNEG